ncbi:hypothetical protein KIPB_007112 [Kipferlia bialata]|uniref:Uncharacterized protein n=1 Tax=Kipferlia bialata TaxID=797122 RepID=A0A9K3CZU9_9EUKA|nr:hypothetical protein KIPB_007112 [Kipferlia bialata]|eukprot:g7112.t1
MRDKDIISSDSVSEDTTHAIHGLHRSMASLRHALLPGHSGSKASSPVLVKGTMVSSPSKTRLESVKMTLGDLVGEDTVGNEREHEREGDTGCRRGVSVADVPLPVLLHIARQDSVQNIRPGITKALYTLDNSVEEELDRVVPLCRRRNALLAVSSAEAGALYARFVETSALVDSIAKQLSKMERGELVESEREWDTERDALDALVSALNLSHKDLVDTVTGEVVDSVGKRLAQAVESALSHTLETVGSALTDPLMSLVTQCYREEDGDEVAALKPPLACLSVVIQTATHRKAERERRTRQRRRQFVRDAMSGDSEAEREREREREQRELSGGLASSHIHPLSPVSPLSSTRSPRTSKGSLGHSQSLRSPTASILPMSQKSPTKVTSPSSPPSGALFQKPRERDRKLRRDASSEALRQSVNLSLSLSQGGDTFATLSPHSPNSTLSPASATITLPTSPSAPSASTIASGVHTGSPSAMDRGARGTRPVLEEDPLSRTLFDVRTRKSLSTDLCHASHTLSLMALRGRQMATIRTVDGGTHITELSSLSRHVSGLRQSLFGAKLRRLLQLRNGAGYVLSRPVDGCQSPVSPSETKDAEVFAQFVSQVTESADRVAGAHGRVHTCKRLLSVQGRRLAAERGILALYTQHMALVEAFICDRTAEVLGIGCKVSLLRE